MSISNKDNTLRGARNLGGLGGSRRINGRVGLRDKIDLAKFTLSDTSEFELTLGRIIGRAGARVTLRNNGGSILQSFRSGASAKTFKSNLEAGTYYVGVQRLRGEVNYRLKASATIVPPVIPTPPGQTPPPPGQPPTDNEPGETLGTARDIGILSGTFTNQEFVGTTDAADIYKFTLTDIANLQARVSGTSARTQLELIVDSNSNGLIDNGEILASDTGSFSSFLSNATQDLPPGAYFVRVAPSSTTTSTQYQIDLVASPFGGNISPEPGNTLPVARDLGTFSGTFSAKEYVGTVDSSDVYKFTLSDIANLQVNVKGLSATAGVRLIRDINGNGLIDSGEIIGSDNSFSSTFQSSITRDVPAGTYFISVDPRSSNGSTRYEMNLVATPFGGNQPVDPGNTLPTARDLGVLSGTFSAKEYVGVLDSDDFYKFTVNNPANLQAKVTGSSENLRLQLIRDTNSNGLIDNGEIIDSDTNFGSTFVSQVTEALASGSYFVRVSPRNTSESTNYSVDLIVT